MSTLLLWDLDETLITTGGAGERAIVRSARKHWDVEVDLAEIPYSGKTDRMIGRLIREHFEIPSDEATDLAYLEDFVNFVTEELPESSARVLPGIREIVECAHFSVKHYQGMLTGNLSASARAKLVPFGLWDFFPYGAYAEDSLERTDLGPIALRRAKEHAAVDFLPEDVIVIGDTPHDIACARSFSARCIAVATGKFGLAELESHQPDFLVEDLSLPDVRRFLDL